MDGQLVDRGPKEVEQHLADFRLGQVAQDHRIVEVDRAGEEVIANEGLYLGIELLVAPDEA